MTCCAWPAPRRGCCEAIDDVDRLVLLGDTVELMARQPAPTRWPPPSPSCARSAAVSAPTARSIVVAGQPRRSAGARAGRSSADGSSGSTSGWTRRHPGAVAGRVMAGAGAGDGALSRGMAGGPDVGDPRPLPRSPPDPRVGVRPAARPPADGRAAASASPIDYERARRRRPARARPSAALAPGGAPAGDDARGAAELCARRRCPGFRS